MRFINRKKEMSRLDHLADSAEAALAVIWGVGTLEKRGYYSNGPISTETNTFIIGEAKWKQGPISSHWINTAIEDLRKKGIPSIERSRETNILYVLFIPEKPKQISIPKNVKLIDEEEVINVLE